MKIRQRMEVTGIVQGVGFRPFVFRLAGQLKITGWVTNTADGVLVEAEGTADQLDRFAASLTGEAPALARVAGVSRRDLPATGYRDFTIRPSLAGPDRKVLISPDTAICSDCRRELLDPADRRYRYPFINCTNCGPRYTIITAVPYDRPATSMASFDMCDDCRAEYEDPADRRFHAQPNACSLCGPSLSLFDGDGRQTAGDPVAGTLDLLRQGGIVAIKGLGGFHLAVDPFSPPAVDRLRRRKGREEKPLALMVRDLETAGMLCHLNQVAERALTSTESPIALLRRKKSPELELAPEVAPKSRYLGLMLPYTPLHVLLASEMPVLVMTSANLSEEPLCSDNTEARERLAGIADAYLTHDRDIVLRCDDSIVRLTPHDPGAGPTVLRRARGFVPAPVPMPVSSEASVLALGPELKGSICLTRGGQAFIGQHLGDMKNLQSAAFLKEVAAHLMDILQVLPAALVCDLHPDYMTTAMALEKENIPWPPDLPVFQIQHHHAHILSTQAERGLSGSCVGVALDGTGYGPDGTVWGGEILAVDGTSMKRLGRLRQVWMPGGEKAIIHPPRMTLSILQEVLGAGEALKVSRRLFPGRDEEMEVVAQLVEKRSHGILTSSAGRLFDAFSALMGICLEARYEGQPAIELEVLTPDDVADILPYSVSTAADGVLELDLLPAFAEAAEARLAGTSIALLAGMFHRTVSLGVADLLDEVLKRSDGSAKPAKIPLSGGVFQNEVFCRHMASDLTERGLVPVFHRNVPTNDGGVSLGQAVYGVLSLLEV